MWASDHHALCADVRDPMQEPQGFRATLRGDAVIDLRSYELMRIQGRDTISFLQTKLTCDTRPWATTGGGYGFATDIQGKVIFDGHFRIEPGAAQPTVWAWLAPGYGELAKEHFDRYIIMEDVETHLSPCVSIGVLQRRDPSDADEHDDASPCTSPMQLSELPGLGLAQTFAFAVGERLQLTLWLVPPETSDAALTSLLAQTAGAELASSEGYHAALTHWGVARFGPDIIPGQTIPLEAGAWHGVSFSKGCYLGQEVIERLYARGQPNKRLVALDVAGPPPAPDTPLHDASEAAAGWVTSSAPELDGTTHALAYVRRRWLKDDPTLRLPDGREIVIRTIVGGDPP